MKTGPQLPMPCTQAMPIQCEVFHSFVSFHLTSYPQVLLESGVNIRKGKESGMHIAGHRATPEIASLFIEYKVQANKFVNILTWLDSITFNPV